MDDQLSLLEWAATPKARKRGPSTSKEAARRAMAWATPQCDKLLLILTNAPSGYCRADLVAYSGIKESSACARLKDMADGGIIEVRGVRMGPYGTEVSVYWATEKGNARAKVLRMGR